MTLQTREDRPHTQERPSTNVVTTDSHQSTADRPRCRLCGHVVFVPVSILTGLGRDCRRIVARAAREVAA